MLSGKVLPKHRLPSHDRLERRIARLEARRTCRTSNSRQRLIDAGLVLIRGARLRSRFHPGFSADRLLLEEFFLVWAKVEF
jgi:hypothetical protein